MRIDKDFLGEEPYLHDACFLGFHYDVTNRELQLELTDYYQEKKFSMRFVEVELFEMQSCGFWSSTDRVYCWEIGQDEDVFAGSLFRKTDGEPSFQESEDAVESVLPLISGDTLTVMSKYIDFEEQPYPLQKEENSV